MIDYVILALALTLYFLVGAWLFCYAVDQLGGKVMYEEIISESTKHYVWAYYFGFLITAAFWPVLVIVGLLKRRKK